MYTHKHTHVLAPLFSFHTHASFHFSRSSDHGSVLYCCSPQVTERGGVYQTAPIETSLRTARTHRIVLFCIVLHRTGVYSIGPDCIRGCFRAHAQAHTQERHTGACARTQNHAIPRTGFPNQPPRLHSRDTDSLAAPTTPRPLSARLHPHPRDVIFYAQLVTEVLDRPPVESPARGPQGQAGDGAAAVAGGAANAQTAALQEGSGEEDGDGGGVRERRPSSGRGAAAGLPPPAPLAVATLLRGGGGGGGSAAGEGAATAEAGGGMDGARGPSSDGQGGGGGGGGDEDDDVCVRVCSSSRHKLTETATGHEVLAATPSTSPRAGRRYIPMGRSGESALNLLDGGCAPEEEGYGRDDEL